MVSIQQQLYALRVGLIKIEKRGFFYSHIYARRVLYASRVSKSESVRIKKSDITNEFLQISLAHQKNVIGILQQTPIRLIKWLDETILQSWKNQERKTGVNIKVIQLLQMSVRERFVINTFIPQSIICYLIMRFQVIFSFNVEI